MTDIEIGGASYRIGAPDVFAQFHIARRLAPVMAALAGAFSAFEAGSAEKAEGEAEVASLIAEAARPGAGVFAALEPLANALSQMSDADADYVVKTCLKSCQRANGKDLGYVNVVAPNGRMMFEDIDMPTMLRLVWAVIEGNLTGFFGGSPSILGVLGLLSRTASA
jgi:hypothetical protein